MWALRRVSNPLRNQSNHIVVARACYAEKDILGGITVQGSHNERTNRVFGHQLFPNPCSHNSTISSNSFFWTHNLSSQAGTKSSDGEDELEGFSDLESPPETNKIEAAVVKDGDDAIIESEISEEETEETVESVLGLLDEETESKKEKKSVRQTTDSPVFKLLMETPRQSASSALDKWVNEGKALGRTEFSLALINLRKRRIFGKALQLYEWAEANKHLEFTERDYASQLDLIAKVHGIHKAEKYIKVVPKSFRTETIYRTLLANCVAVGNIKKSEEVFNKIKDLGFPISTFACNQLLLLYKRIDRKKIADVLKLMEKEDVKLSIFTYKLLIDTKGRAHDISAMEDLVEMMKVGGIEPDLGIKSLTAKHYIFANLNEKAESTLKEIEGGNINENRVACRELLPLYAALGKSDDVERIWEVCKSDPRLEECLACIEAWGKLGEIENAEKVFDQMMKTWKRLSARYYNCMIKVYANHKLLSKGKDLAKRMSENGCRIGPLTWDALVRLYVESGEVEKADSILQKAVQQNQIKPLYSSYMIVLENYARRGDVHNAEKIFQNIRQNGYTGRMGMYQSLLTAYVNAKSPIYGFRERMKADNVVPNKAVGGLLAAIDAFKKTQMSELLD